MKSFNNKLKFLLTLLCLTWGLVSSAQQRGIDEKYNFSGSFNRVRGTQSCLFTASQTGNKVVGRINFSNPRIQGNYTGTITNGVVHATITWVSAPDDLKKATFLRLQKFTDRNFPELSLFDNANYRTNNRVRSKIVYGLEKKVFGSTSTTAQNNPSSVANSNTKAARDIGGYYRIEGMTDATGTKRNLFVNVRNFPDDKDKSKAYGEALIIGEAYGIGSPQGKLFGYETNGDNVTVMFDPIFEQNKKVTMANGRIVNTSGGMSLVAPRLAYRMVKVSQAEAERESKKLSPTVKVRVEYKFIYVNDSFEWPKTALNSTQTFYSSFDRAIYGTGSIKATLETSSSTTAIKSIGNLSERVFDAPKSRPVTKGFKSYYFEKKNNLAWGRGKGNGYGFYKFAKDAEFPKPHNDSHTGEFLIEMGYKREFEVPRASLEGKDQRVGIQVSAHLSNSAGTGDITFGNMHRKVYLHELGVTGKLSEGEKYVNNVKHENKISTDPIYYTASVTKGPFLVTFVVFTVEIIE